MLHLINGNDAYDLELYYREVAKAKREQAESWACELGIAEVDAKAMSDDDLYTMLESANIRYAGGWERYCNDCGEAAFTEDGNGIEFCANCRFETLAADGMIDAKPGETVNVGGVSFIY